MTPYEWFLAWHPLALTLPAIWMCVAYTRAALLAVSPKRNLLLTAGLAALVLAYCALIIALSQGGGGVLVLYLAIILAQYFTITLRRAPSSANKSFISLDQHVAALAFARRPALVDPRPSRALRRRAASIFAVFAVLAGTLFALGWQLQPCAALDRSLQISGCLRQLRVPQRWSHLAALAPDGHTLALASRADSGISLIDTRTAQPLASLAPAGEIVALAWSPDSGLLAVGNHHEIVEVWDVTSQQLLWRHKLGGDSWPKIAFSPDGGQLAVAQADQGPQLLRAKDGVQLGPLATPPGRVDDIAFSPGGRWLAVVAWRGVALYDLATSQLLPAMVEDGVQLSWADADSLLITGNDTVYVARAENTGLRIERDYGLGWTFPGALFMLTPAGRPLVAHANWSYHLQGDLVIVRTLDNNATVRELRFPGESVGSITLLPDGELLTVQHRTLDDDSTLRVWRLPAVP